MFKTSMVMIVTGLLLGLSACNDEDGYFGPQAYRSASPAQQMAPRSYERPSYMQGTSSRQYRCVHPNGFWAGGRQVGVGC